MTSLKERLASGEQLLGVLVRMPAEEMIEMAAVAGMDFVFIDCEHGPADLIPLRHHITAAQMRTLGVVVRVGQNEPALIQRVLDHGAEAIVLPHIDTPEQARAAVHATRYPPVGDRGFATYGRTGNFGNLTAADVLRDAADTTMTIPMIESRTGCDNAEAILAVDGIDAVMCGPADLAVSLGVTTPTDPRVSSAIDEVHTLARSAHRARMEIVSSKQRARQSLDAGTGMVVYNLSHLMMELLGHLIKP